MGFLNKIVVLIAMTAAGASALGTQSLAFQSPPVERPLGCHEHGGKTPAPRPVSYQCCMTGHDTAVPQASPLPTVLSEDPAEIVSSFAARFASDGISRDRAIDSGGPPESSPLRI